MDITKKYGKKDPLKHILDKPGMYIGGIDNDEHTTWIVDDNNKIVWKTINYSHGLLQIFREILMNAIDQSKRPESKDMTEIKVSITDDGIITVNNDGQGIPVVEHPEHKVYIPEMLFSHFASSSNYNDSEERVVSGTNGLGAKATVVFSKYFKITTIDTINKKKFSQVYKDNLKTKEKYKITDIYPHSFKGRTNPIIGGTTIKFIPDYERFNTTPQNIKDFISVAKKDVYDACLLTDERIKIYFNGGRQIGVKSIKDYMKLFTDNPVVYDEYNHINKNGTNYHWKWGITSGMDTFKHISFVNGVPTVDGGTHVDYVMKQITKGLMNTVKKDVKVSETDIRNHSFLFLIATVDKPEFGGQTKEKLATKATKFGCSFEINDKFIKSVKTKTDILNNALSHAKFKEERQLEKTDGKRVNNIGKIPKLEDANWAGTKKSNECCLILTEGDSAKASVMSGINVLGRNKYGVFPLKGKLLNVRDKSVADITKNEEIQNIKKILGLQQNVSYDNGKEGLRYHKIMIITDADVDGTHIKGLIINYIGHFWPSLLKCNDFITCMATPIIKTWKGKGKDTNEFYSLGDYEKWLETHKGEKWETKYFKGLGTSTKKEFEAYCGNPKIIDFKIKKEKDDIDSIALAFDKKRANDRKTWLAEYDPNAGIDYNKTELNYTDFINDDLKHFSVADNVRSIPSIMDGLKPSQRKILYAGFKRNLVKEIKVAQFAGYISENTSYHHGEMSLNGAIIGLAQDFVGSNNINLFSPNGQFGTRLKGGSDNASARYIFTQLMDITRVIFNKNDEALLKYIKDEGQLIEPVWYVPIIPMVLVNGADGIGTGYSSKIPNYNPRDIIDNIRRKLSGKKCKDMVPWYRHFKGDIKETDEKGAYETFGIVSVVDAGKNIIEIGELPVKVWTDKYMEYLDDYVINKKEPKKKQFIKKYEKHNSDTEVRIVLHLARPFDKKKDIVNLKLINKISTSNMCLYDSKNVIKKYDNVCGIIDEFYDVRLSFYEKRKAHMLKEMERELKEINNKAKFVLGIVNGDIVINKKSKEEIIGKLDDMKFDKIDGNYDYLTRMPIYNLTKEKIIELQGKLNKITEIYNDLKGKSIQKLWDDDLDELEKYL